MAKVNNIRPGVEIAFSDKTRTIYPVSLRQLRKLNKVMKEMEISEDDDKSVDLMVEAASIILEAIEPEIASDPELVEDLLDIKSFNQLISAAMGTDPNV
jgi:hydroxylamine reductase (hybrid-cluster protein)